MKLWGYFRSSAAFRVRIALALKGLPVEHDLSVQLIKLENTLRFFTNEELITHLGLTYYGVDEGQVTVQS